MPTNNSLQIVGRNASATVILNYASSAGSIPVTGKYTHVLASWNLATTVTQMYINDTTDAAAVSTATDDNIDYTQTAHAVGAYVNAINFLTGRISELWFNPTYLDISVEANRRKFISPSGSPVNLGATGSLPTGTAPLIYMPGAVVGQNLGTGGDFAAVGAPKVVTGPAGSSGDLMMIPMSRGF